MLFLRKRVLPEDAVDLIIAMTGADAVAEATTLKEWIHEGRLKGVQSIDQMEAPPKTGEQGPDLLAILTVVLSAQATIELVRSIQRYIEARKPKIEIELKTTNRSFKIRAENPSSTAELTELASKLSND
jgi:hypothetical protein